MRLERYTGARLLDYIDELARLRIEVFRAFPYLYEGDPAYEARYLKTYIESPGSVIVLALEGDSVVGAASGIPLKYETDVVKKPFLDAGYDIDSLFYCGESVLLDHYRGQGIGVEFFRHREAHAKSLGGFSQSCFCAVQRPADHPLRPTDYVPLDGFWEKRGYTKQPELTTQFSWRELGEASESPKPMTFWLKTL
ncbi:GNAT family N-acetyltransferase [Neptuniibacter sp. CAU 1671]|uniref:GNAT family N-acetyltransferase n=1 Tax=Neptuniibacter sp. CAU 1671 TaxID=3032593 RepID=UPI0023DCB62E|nr:GNAT family N-acetyltransferase [Neptuniibacter sp. CAU 1671]MDF2181943.1 GNAT family N-acetyltransferase [Neptuniibacter sp. CAU 1671]